MKLVLTGSSSGIGRALALHLLEKGHSIWGLARTDQSALARERPGRFRSRRCDVTVWPEMESAAGEVGAAWSGIDGLICCAGWQGEIGRAVAADPIRWSATVRANLDGTYFAIRAFHRLFRQGARVVCFSGGGSTHPRPNFSAYGSAKAALVRLVETIALEEGSALAINAVAPGAVATRMTEELIELGPSVVGAEEYEAAVKRKEQGPATPDRAIALVEWLLSAGSDGVTGRLISAQWDPWPFPEDKRAELAKSDLYTLRRVAP